jgi:hypothetical protein
MLELWTDSTPEDKLWNTYESRFHEIVNVICKL